MPNYFLDSSAIVKYYHPEVGSDVITRLLNEPDGRYFISRLAGVEVHRAFVGKVRAKQILAEELEDLSQHFADDITLKRFIVIRLTDALYDEAENLVRRYGPADTDPLLRTLGWGTTHLTVLSYTASAAFSRSQRLTSVSVDTPWRRA